MNLNTSEFKVTYLLGAGASVKALPTVNLIPGVSVGLSSSLIGFANSLNQKINDYNPKYHDFILQIANDLIEIGENSEKFGTPDTYAKFLYLTDRQKLTSLKKALSFYFTAKQLVFNEVDHRPLSFLTTVMQLGEVFPTNIKILSWNYDIQVQLAAETFKKERSTHQRGVSVRVPPLVDYFPSVEMSVKMNDPSANEHIEMVHLNGIAGFYVDELANGIINPYIYERPKTIDELAESILGGSPLKHTLLTFAWETNTKEATYLRERIKIAASMIQHTHILVIIGYSFPFFNREVDKQIFNALKASNNFIKIYYQDPVRDGAFLKNQFGLPDKIEINHISNTENYFVPHEI